MAFLEDWLLYTSENFTAKPWISLTKHLRNVTSPKEIIMVYGTGLFYLTSLPIIHNFIGRRKWRSIQFFGFFGILHQSQLGNGVLDERGEKERNEIRNAIVVWIPLNLRLSSQNGPISPCSHFGDRRWNLFYWRASLLRDNRCFNKNVYERQDDVRCQNLRRIWGLRILDTC